MLNLEQTLTDRKRIAVIILVAALLSLPVIVLGLPTYTADSGHDAGPALLWLDRFARQFWLGDLYPRWLVEGDNGMGQPTFYYYPPLAYWIGALLRGPGQGWMTVDQALGFALLLGRLWAGVFTFVWLRRHLPPAGAMFGAAFYISCTYNFDVDVFVRSAFAETMALSFFPLILLGIEDTISAKRFGVLLLSFSVAVATLAHVLTLVLLAIPCGVYAILLGWRTPQRMILAGIAAVGGLALDGFYLIPALSLQNLVHLQSMFGDAKDPVNWLLGAELFRQTRPHLLLLILGQLGLSAVAWFIFMVSRQRRRLLPMEAVAAITLMIAVFMLTGWSAPIWADGLPFYRVQLPWRLMGFISLLSAFLLGSGYSHSGLALRGSLALAILLVGLAPAAWALIDYKFVRMPQRFADGTNYDVKEYVPQSWTGPLSGQVLTVQAPGFIFHGPERGNISPGPWQGSGLTVSVASPRGGMLVVPQHFFPTWRVIDENGSPLVIQAAEPWGLLGVKVPPGDHEISIARAPLPQEVAGWIVSLAALAAMIALAWLVRRGVEAVPSRGGV